MKPNITPDEICRIVLEHTRGTIYESENPADALLRILEDAAAFFDSLYYLPGESVGDLMHIVRRYVRALGHSGQFVDNALQLYGSIAANIASIQEYAPLSQACIAIGENLHDKE